MATGGLSEDNAVHSHFRDLISDLNSVSQDLDDSDQPEFESSNCKYYECHELTAISPTVKSAFSTFHLNISSLSRNFDELNALLAQLGFDFSIIGISESRLLMHNASVFNFSIEGYSVEHTLTESAAGGALLYMTRSSRNVLFSGST